MLVVPFQESSCGKRSAVFFFSLSPGMLLFYDNSLHKPGVLLSNFNNIRVTCRCCMKQRGFLRRYTYEMEWLKRYGLLLRRHQFESYTVCYWEHWGQRDMDMFKAMCLTL